MIYSFLQSSLKVRYTLCAASESHLLAQIVPAFPADCALSARNADLEGNSVTNGKARDLRANTDNYTGRFMSKGQWCTGTEVAIGKLLVVADI